MKVPAGHNDELLETIAQAVVRIEAKVDDGFANADQARAQMQRDLEAKIEGAEGFASDLYDQLAGRVGRIEAHLDLPPLVSDSK